MMTNLFSIFDPSTNILNIPFNWMSAMLGFLFIPYMYWFMPNRQMISWNLILGKLNTEFELLLMNKELSKINLFFITLFSFILFNNFLGMFPYIFTSTSHLILPLFLSLSTWLSLMFYGWINNTQHMFSHMIPQGTPQILQPFMVLIETISNIIRPGTLAIRLTANMIAGHLLIVLLSSTGPMFNSYLLFILILIQILLLTIEFAVSIIQAYVITILSTLYSSEVN